MNADATGVGDEGLTAFGLRRRLALTLPYLAALPAVLATTDLVSIVPERFARTVAGDTLSIFSPSLPLPRFEVQMLWPPATRTDAGLAWSRRMVIAVSRGV